MKMLLNMFMFTVLFLLGATALAQFPVVPPTGDEWLGLLNQLGTVKGASTLALVTLGVQAAMLALRQWFGQISGEWKFRAVAFLSLVGALAVELAKAPKLDVAAVLMAAMSAPVIMAINVLVHQTWKVEVKKA